MYQKLHTLIVESKNNEFRDETYLFVQLVLCKVLIQLSSHCFQSACDIMFHLIFSSKLTLLLYAIYRKVTLNNFLIKIFNGKNKLKIHN